MAGQALSNDVRNRPAKPPLGWPFLQVPDATGIWVWPNLAQSLQNQIKVILLTRPGEQLMAPDFGAGLDNELHEQDGVVTRAHIRELIAASLKSWENRIVVDAISVEPSTADSSEVLIMISYRALFNALPQNLTVALPLGGF